MAKYIFVLDLIQDYFVQVRIIKEMLSQSHNVLVIYTKKFRQRDIYDIFRWRVEALAFLGANVKGPLPFDRIPSFVANSRGIIVTSSESSHRSHADMYNLIKSMPPYYVSVTLQHGFESIGIRSNSDTNSIFEFDNIDFSSDYVIGFERAENVPVALKAKYIEAPIWTLYSNSRDAKNHEKSLKRNVILCETSHSPKFNHSSTFGDFVDLCRRCRQICDDHNLSLSLRPHPGKFSGLHKDVIHLFDDVVALPFDELDLSDTLVVISPPSTVCVDAVLRGVPVLVWDNNGKINSENFYMFENFSYQLPSEESLFATWSAAYRALDEIILIDTESPAEGVCKIIKSISDQRRLTDERVETNNISVAILSEYSPTLLAWFKRPLESDVNEGCFFDLPKFENVMEKCSDPKSFIYSFGHFLKNRGCGVLVINRSKVVNFEIIIGIFKNLGIKVKLFLDDDFLSLSTDLGEKFHSNRTVADDNVRMAMLNNADSVIASTKVLAASIARSTSTIVESVDYIGAGPCLMKYPVLATKQNVHTLGYAGVGHATDFQMIEDAVHNILNKNVNIKFEFLGVTPSRGLLKDFPDRVAVHEAKLPRTLQTKDVISVQDYYEAYRKFLGSRNWTVGICPLVRSPFNRCKSSIKLYEYIDAGILPVCTREEPYVSSPLRKSVVFADHQDGWEEALYKALSMPFVERVEKITKGQKVVKHESDVYRNKILSLLLKGTSYARI